jgi:hypothetical protein
MIVFIDHMRRNVSVERNFQFLLLIRLHNNNINDMKDMALFFLKRHDSDNSIRILNDALCINSCFSETN